MKLIKTFYTILFYSTARLAVIYSFGNNELKADFVRFRCVQIFQPFRWTCVLCKVLIMMDDATVLYFHDLIELKKKKEGILFLPSDRNSPHWTSGEEGG